MVGDVCVCVDAYSTGRAFVLLELQQLDKSASTRRTQVFVLLVFVLVLVQWVSFSTNDMLMLMVLLMSWENQALNT